MYEFGDMVSHVETQEMRDRMKLGWLLDLPLGQKMGFSLAN
jgi:hypothetical protein